MSESNIQKEESGAIKIGFLLISGFLLPFLIVFLTSHDNDTFVRVFRGMRLGGLGFFLSLVIIWLGHMDQRLHVTATADKKSQLVVLLLGMMLWVVWLGTGQIVFMAVDETTVDTTTNR